jgi:hypothetical protein
MSNSNTYFEQVPLELVKHIIDEQIQVNPAGEAFQVTDSGAGSEVLFEPDEQSIARLPTFNRKESSNQS